MKLPSNSFYGDTSKTVSSADFGLTETVYAPTVKLPVHSHEAAYSALFSKAILPKFTENARARAVLRRSFFIRRAKRIRTIFTPRRGVSTFK